jgi:geranylgeranyl pyrophosphate synthase
MSTNPKHASAPFPSTLIELLDRSWNDDALAALCGVGERRRDASSAPFEVTEPVPREAWEQALLGPARDILSRPGKRFREVLVALSWKLAGGRGEVPPNLPLLIEIIHAGSLVIDDVEDDSSQRRGAACIHRLHGAPLAINLGNWLYFWPLELLGELGLGATIEGELRRSLGRAMFHCHFGQALDLSQQVGRVPQRWIPPVVSAAADLKTGSLMELAARVGALAAEAPAPRVAILARFGRSLGVGLQMLDDLGNLAPGAGEDPAHPGGKSHEDLRLGRPTWPWAWAAQAMDEVSFAGLQAEARVVCAQAVAGRRPATEPLAASLRAAFGVTGRRAARVHLERAMGDLECALGRAPELALVTEEIERLEVAYG